MNLFFHVLYWKYRNIYHALIVKPKKRLFNRHTHNSIKHSFSLITLLIERLIVEKLSCLKSFFLMTSFEVYRCSLVGNLMAI